jgi:hypothetical protein
VARPVAVAGYKSGVRDLSGLTKTATWTWMELAEESQAKVASNRQCRLDLKEQDGDGEQPRKGGI